MSRHPAVEFLFECKVAKVDLENASISYSCSGDNEVRSIEGEAIFGCDGAFSAVRYAMQKTSRFNYQQDYLPHGYKELCVPPLDEIPGKCFLSGASDGCVDSSLFLVPSDVPNTLDIGTKSLETLK